MAARYLVGIDLGTTNTACAYVDTRTGRTIEVFDIPQLVAPGEVRARPPLPSFLYLAGAHDLPAGVSPCRGRRTGTSASASWHASRARACPAAWCRRRSRGSATAASIARRRSCRGVRPRTCRAFPRWTRRRASWRTCARPGMQRFPEPLAAQQVVLTVPASFDEVARELTLAAARDAGLPDVVLLEEPQAAFYAWLLANESTWRARLASEAARAGGRRGRRHDRPVAHRGTDQPRRARPRAGRRRRPPAARRRQHRPGARTQRRVAHAARRWAARHASASTVS